MRSRPIVLGFRAAALAWALAVAPSHAAVSGSRTASTARPESIATPAAQARRPSLKDSPGWTPLVDPESTAVRLGRRPGAALVAMPLQGGVRSLDAIGRAACWALHHERSDTLLRLCVTMDEFRVILWPEFPQSRPATGLTWEDGWIILNARLVSGCRGSVQDHGGHWLEFVRFERRDPVAAYKNFKLHNGLVLVARDGQGGEQRFDFLRSVVERKGVFKIYSVRD